MIETFHAANWKTSARLKKAADFVRRYKRYRFTPWGLANAIGCTNPTGILSELSHRKNGFVFDRITKISATGRRVSYYKTLVAPK